MDTYFSQVAISPGRPPRRFQVPPATRLRSVLRGGAAQGPSAHRAHQRVQARLRRHPQPSGSDSVPLAHSVHSLPRGHHTSKHPTHLHPYMHFLFVCFAVLNLLFFQIVLPPHLERIREKLAENSHELWAVTRIEQGWTFGAVRFFVIFSTANACKTNLIKINCFISFCSSFVTTTRSCTPAWWTSRVFLSQRRTTT